MTVRVLILCAALLIALLALPAGCYLTGLDIGAPIRWDLVHFSDGFEDAYHEVERRYRPRLIELEKRHDSLPPGPEREKIDAEGEALYREFIAEVKAVRRRYGRPDVEASGRWRGLLPRR